MTLVAGTQSVTISEFYTTNAVCYTPSDRPTSSLSLDIELKTVQSYDAPAVFGKQYPVTYSLRCRVVLLLLFMALAQVVYPLSYDRLQQLQAVPCLLVLARNLTLLAWGILLLRPVAAETAADPG